MTRLPLRLLIALFVALALLLGACDRPAADARETAHRAETSQATRWTLLADDLPGLLEEAGVSGLAIAVVNDGILEMNRGFGVADTSTGSPVTPETVFEAASLSKPIVAYRSLQLVSEGGLDLDTPLNRYIAFEDLQGDERIDRITARSVLSHSSGFPNWRRDAPLTIGFDPGSQFSYSGEGFVYLGRVIEQLTGDTLAETIRRSIFEPLGMKSSSFVWRPDYATRAAVGHNLLGDPREKSQPETANAAASLHTTAADYARFIAEMMTPTLIPSTLGRAMLTPQIDVADGVSWGLGWGLEEVPGDMPEKVSHDGSESDRRGGTYFWHWGDNGVFRCFTAASVDHKSGVVFLTNSENGLSITREIVRRTLGGEHHPALVWKDYAAYDSPAFQVRKQLLTAGLESADALLAAYQSLRASQPPEAFAESLLNNIAYGLLYRDSPDAAVALFELIVAGHPDSSNAYDSLGEGLMIRGNSTSKDPRDIERAIVNYEESLALDPSNRNAAAMLDRLRGNGAGE